MSVVYHSAPNKQYLDNIHDAIPLDNSSSISVSALPYVAVPALPLTPILELMWLGGVHTPLAPSL